MNDKPRSFIGSAKLLAGMMLVSRILGMVRDMLAANFFGMTKVWDAFLIAFLVPNMFRRLFGEGALASAFVPVFVDHLEQQGKPAASRLLSALATGVVIILTALSGIGILAALAISNFTDSPQTARVCELLAIMLPYMVLICFVAVISAALNSLNHFAAPAAAPVLLNVVLISTLLAITGSKANGVVVLSIAVVGGGVLQVLLQLGPLLMRGIRLRPSLDFRQPGVREVGRLFLPATLGVGLLQINELLDKIIAAVFVDEGGVSALYFADRFTFLPLAMIGVALGTAVFPALSRAASRKDHEAFDTTLARGLRVALFLAIPAATGLLLIPDLIVRVVYERGEFEAAATRRTAFVLFFYATGLVFYTVNHLLIRAFYARKDTASPFRVMGGMVFVNLGLNLVLVRTELAEAGLALATAITGLLNLILLALMLRRTHHVRMMRGVAATAGRTLLIAGAIALLLYVLRDPARVPMDSDILRLAICVLGAILITFALGFILCRAEARAILGKAR